MPLESAWLGSWFPFMLEGPSLWGNVGLASVGSRWLTLLKPLCAVNKMANAQLMFLTIYLRTSL